MNSIELNTAESAMLDTVRKKHMFVDVEPGINGKRNLVIRHRLSTTVAEYNPDDKVRIKELSRFYGVE